MNELQQSRIGPKWLCTIRSQHFYLRRWVNDESLITKDSISIYDNIANVMHWIVSTFNSIRFLFSPSSAFALNCSNLWSKTSKQRSLKLLLQQVVKMNFWASIAKAPLWSYRFFEPQLQKLTLEFQILPDREAVGRMDFDIVNPVIPLLKQHYT